MDHHSVTAAISLASAGVALSEAMHVTSKPPSSVFATFDRRLVRAAKRAGTSGVAEVPSKQ